MNAFINKEFLKRFSYKITLPMLDMMELEDLLFYL